MAQLVIFPDQESNPYPLHWHVLSCFNHVRLFVIPRTVAHPAPLSMDSPGKNTLPFPPPGNLPNLGIKPLSLMSPALADRFFTPSATWEAPCIGKQILIHCPTREFLFNPLFLSSYTIKWDLSTTRVAVRHSKTLEPALAQLNSPQLGLLWYLFFVVEQVTVTLTVGVSPSEAGAALLIWSSALHPRPGSCVLTGDSMSSLGPGCPGQDLSHLSPTSLSQRLSGSLPRSWNDSLFLPSLCPQASCAAYSPSAPLSPEALLAQPC